MAWIGQGVSRFVSGKVWRCYAMPSTPFSRQSEYNMAGALQGRTRPRHAFSSYKNEEFRCGCFAVVSGRARNAMGLQKRSEQSGFLRKRETREERFELAGATFTVPGPFAHEHAHLGLP